MLCEAWSPWGNRIFQDLARSPSATGEKTWSEWQGCELVTVCFWTVSGLDVWTVCYVFHLKMITVARAVQDVFN